jgi:biopolymer transport protein ExbD
MRFKQQDSGVPEVDLIPMLNVMMGILAFFVMITMTLTAEESVQVELPNKADAPPPEEETTPPDPLIVQLDPQGELLLNQESISVPDMEAQVQSYLTNNPEGFVVLQADLDLPYQDVVQLLQDMQEIGGDRVSLAIE